MAEIKPTSNPDESVRVAIRIIEFTKQKKLEWQRFTPPKDPDEGEILDAYRARFDDHLLGLFRIGPRRSKSPLGLALESLYDYTAIIRLSLIDDRGRELWVLSKAQVLKDLLSVVRFEASGARDFVEKLLTETEEVKPPAED